MPKKNKFLKLFCMIVISIKLMNVFNLKNNMKLVFKFPIDLKQKSFTRLDKKVVILNNIKSN